MLRSQFEHTYLGSSATVPERIERQKAIVLAVRTTGTITGGLAEAGDNSKLLLTLQVLSLILLFFICFGYMTTTVFAVAGLGASSIHLCGRIALQRLRATGIASCQTGTQQIECIIRELPEACVRRKMCQALLLRCLLNFVLLGEPRCVNTHEFLFICGSLYFGAVFTKVFAVTGLGAFSISLRERIASRHTATQQNWYITKALTEACVIAKFSYAYHASSLNCVVLKETRCVALHESLVTVKELPYDD
jgi:hypothetical protein